MKRIRGRVTQTIIISEGGKTLAAESKEKEILKYVCPFCSESFMALNALKGHITTQHGMEPKEKGWGQENYPYPVGGGLYRMRGNEMCGLWNLPDGLLHETFWGDQ